MNKTPISILTELCTQKKVNKPTFTELEAKSLDENNQNFKFHIKCSAFGKSAIGGGVTKKGAKHAAAEILLKKINKNYDSSDEDEQPNYFCSTDYVSELLNLCVQKNFHKPNFVLIEAFGPTHAPVFTVECRLDSIKRSGSASNKQTAKKLAAQRVLEILKLSYPDQEKKVMLVNDQNMAKEESRRKITSYLDLKGRNKTDKMGTLLTNRHNFFVDYKDEEFIESLRATLVTDKSLEEKYQDFIEILTTEWDYRIEPFADTELKMFELLIDFDQFTVNIVAKEEELSKEVIKYFMDMLHLTPIEERVEQKIFTADDLSVYNL